MNNIFNRKFLPTVLLAAAGVLVAASPASAVLSYTAGDLFMGFRTDNVGDGAVIINIGQASNYRDATGNFALSVGNLNSVLTAQFGAGWDTRTDLYVGIAGSPSNTATVNGDPFRTNYGSKAQDIFGTQSDPWALDPGARGSTSTLMQGIDDGFLAGTNSALLTNGGTQTSSTPNWWGSYMPGGANSGGIAFGAFNPTIEDSFNGGASTVSLDLYRILHTNTGATEPGTVGSGQYSGTFTFTSGGGINYSTSPGAVPEPSRAFLIVAGLGSFLFRRRRAAAI